MAELTHRCCRKQGKEKKEIANILLLLKSLSVVLSRWSGKPCYFCKFESEKALYFSYFSFGERFLPERRMFPFPTSSGFYLCLCFFPFLLLSGSVSSSSLSLNCKVFRTRTSPIKHYTSEPLMSNSETKEPPMSRDRNLCH